MSETEAKAISKILGGTARNHGDQGWMVEMRRKDATFVVLSDRGVREYSCTADFDEDFQPTNSIRFFSGFPVKSAETTHHAEHSEPSGRVAAGTTHGVKTMSQATKAKYTPYPNVETATSEEMVSYAESQRNEENEGGGYAEKSGALIAFVEMLVIERDSLKRQLDAARKLLADERCGVTRGGIEVSQHDYESDESDD